MWHSVFNFTYSIIDECLYYSELLKVPPGFDSGMTFGDEGEPLPFKTEPFLANTQQEDLNILNVADLLSGLDEIEFLDEAPEEPTESEKVG